MSMCRLKRHELFFLKTRWISDLVKNLIGNVLLQQYKSFSPSTDASSNMQKTKTAASITACCRCWLWSQIRSWQCVWFVSARYGGAEGSWTRFSSILPHFIVHYYLFFGLFSELFFPLWSPPVTGFDRWNLPENLPEGQVAKCTKGICAALPPLDD